MNKNNIYDNSSKRYSFFRLNQSHIKQEKYSKFNGKISKSDIKTSFKETVTQTNQNHIITTSIEKITVKSQNSNRTSYILTKNNGNYNKNPSVEEMSDNPKGYYSTTPFKEISTEKPNNYKKYRIDTKGCKISNWPLFDRETKKLYKNLTNERLNCDSRRPLIKIKRVNSTWIQLDWSELNYKPFCYNSELIRGEGENSVRFGK
jgi:hypothetical protein